MWNWIFSLIVCRGTHQYMLRFLGDQQGLECSRCGRLFKIPESLTRPSGPFTPEARQRTREILRTQQVRPTKVQDIKQFKTFRKGA
ncbi:MAG: hypothetical protein DMG05_15165 [Acidobacteria bacterium]|nr:MAG: hypothetical protein DMG05_15165 [Acidobacteriota bacterium]